MDDSSLVSNGSVDYKGRIADKRSTGGWKASPFIIVNEVAERLAFFAIAVNMATYLVREMHQHIPNAATHVTDWIGAAYVLTLLGAFLADSYLGRFRTIIIFSCIYVVGMMMLTFSASLDGLRPPRCTKLPCTPATTNQKAFLYGALGLIALGTGGIKPCVSSFGADQFDESDRNEAQHKYSYFNWFFFAISMGAVVGTTLMVYIREQFGWTWGFAVPTGTVVCSIFIVAAGWMKYRYQKPMGSAFTRFVQVIVVSVRNHARGVETGQGSELYEVKTRESAIFGARKLSHTPHYRFLDKAAVITDPECNTKNRWEVCTVTQVEECKSFVRVLPVWASTIALAISYAQLSTFFVQQAYLMDRKLGHSHFKIPAPSTPFFTSLTALILVPAYEKLMVPFLRARTGHPRGITSLQRMGIGLFISIFAMVAAALVERKRRDKFTDHYTFLSVFWLVPQFFLIGAAEVLTYVGQLEFFYNEATDGTRSLSSAIFLSEIGIGSWMSTAIVKIIKRATGGVETGWLRDDLNKSRLENLYWILAGINCVNLVVYTVVAMRYKSGNDGVVSVRDESLTAAESAAESAAEEDRTEQRG